MPGTRTAPTVGADTSLWVVSYRMIDTFGDYRTLSVPVIQDAVTPVSFADVYAAAETVAANLQAASNASLYEVALQARYVGVRARANAVDDVHASADNRLVIGFSDALRQQSISPGIFAPIDAMFAGGTENPDPTNATLVTLTNSISALLNQSAQAAFAARSYRLTERREINEAVPF